MGIMKESSNIQFVVVDQPPAELPVASNQEFTLVATYNNYPEMILANPSLGVETEKIKASEWQDELEALETRNKELREQEEAMVERLAKVQGAYINLIKAGRIKCV